jgi:hemerythrin-like domain-containing protein
MTAPTGYDSPCGACLRATDHALLKDGLEFIAADHLRERCVCMLLDRIAAGDCSAPQEVSRAVDFLQTDLPLHLADEQEDLFPLMRRCCLPEDEIDRVISRLLLDHQQAGDSTPEVLSVLARVLQSAPLTLEAQQLLARFTSFARRHLILETAVILPIARLRLRDSDHQSLRLRMMQRRGLDTKTTWPHRRPPQATPAGKR